MVYCEVGGNLSEVFDYVGEIIWECNVICC